MKKVLILILVFSLFASASGCGTPEIAPDPSPAAEAGQSWGVSVTETQEGAQTLPAIADTAANVTEETAELSDAEKADLSQVLLALIMCDFADGLRYDPQNSTFFWRAMNYYAASVCYEMDALSEDMCWAVFTEDQVKEFAGRMFANSEAFPALPDIGMIEKWDDGTYAFTLGNYGDIQLEMGEMKVSSNGRFIMEATLYGGDELLGVWSFEFIKTDDRYCVSGILYG